MPINIEPVVLSRRPKEFCRGANINLDVTINRIAVVLSPPLLI